MQDMQKYSLTPSELDNKEQGVLTNYALGNALLNKKLQYKNVPFIIQLRNEATGRIKFIPGPHLAPGPHFGHHLF